MVRLCYVRAIKKSLFCTITDRSYSGQIAGAKLIGNYTGDQQNRQRDMPKTATIEKPLEKYIRLFILAFIRWQPTKGRVLIQQFKGVYLPLLGQALIGQHRRGTAGFAGGVTLTQIGGVVD